MNINSYLCKFVECNIILQPCSIVESPCPCESSDPVGFSTRQHVLHELATMLRVYDVTDPSGRTALQTLITDVLTG